VEWEKGEREKKRNGEWNCNSSHLFIPWLVVVVVVVVWWYTFVYERERESGWRREGLTGAPNSGSRLSDSGAGNWMTSWREPGTRRLFYLTFLRAAVRRARWNGAGTF
jgi:hypothetical protein